MHPTLSTAEQDLHGNIIILKPLRLSHVPALLHAARDPQLWRHTLYGDLSRPDNMAEFVTQALHRRESGSDAPFSVIHKKSGRIIGCTRYRDISMQYFKLEIGGTWFDRDYHRSGANLESKYLLLRHAFETLGMLRVQFTTDSRNEGSQKSLEKLGAVCEGRLRKHAIMPDGIVRDTLIYSILDTEWNTVKQSIAARLNRASPPYPMVNATAAQTPVIQA